MNGRRNRRGMTFSKEQLEDYVLIKTPIEKVELRVTRPVTEASKISDPEKHKSRYIVSLNAIAIDKLQEILDLFKDRDTVPIEETNRLFMTANIWANGDLPPQLPLKNELVYASIDYVNSRNNGVSVLRVTDIVLKPATRLEPISFSELFSHLDGTSLESRELSKKEE